MFLVYSLFSGCKYMNLSFSRWEVYHDWGNSSSNDLEENRRKSRTYVSNDGAKQNVQFLKFAIHPLQNEHSPPPSFRMASSTAYKAHSWRGDHPMKPQPAGKYFEHEPRQHGGGGNGSHSHNIR